MSLTVTFLSLLSEHLWLTEILAAHCSDCQQTPFESTFLDSFYRLSSSNFSFLWLVAKHFLNHWSFWVVIHKYLWWVIGLNWVLTLSAMRSIYQLALFFYISVSSFRVSLKSAGFSPRDRSCFCRLDFAGLKYLLIHRLTDPLCHYLGTLFLENRDSRLCSRCSTFQCWDRLISRSAAWCHQAKGDGSTRQESWNLF